LGFFGFGSGSRREKEQYRAYFPSFRTSDIPCIRVVKGKGKWMRGKLMVSIKLQFLKNNPDYFD
jgi:hypothetical protein